MKESACPMSKDGRDWAPLILMKFSHFERTAAEFEFLSSTFRTLINEGLFRDWPTAIREESEMKEWKTGNCQFSFFLQIICQSHQLNTVAGVHPTLTGMAPTSPLIMTIKKSILLLLSRLNWPKRGGGWVLRREWCCAYLHVMSST